MIRPTVTVQIDELDLWAVPGHEVGAALAQRIFDSLSPTPGGRG